VGRRGGGFSGRLDEHEFVPHARRCLRPHSAFNNRRFLLHRRPATVIAEGGGRLTAGPVRGRLSMSVSHVPRRRARRRATQRRSMPTTMFLLMCCLLYARSVIHGDESKDEAPVTPPCIAAVREIDSRAVARGGPTRSVAAAQARTSPKVRGPGSSERFEAVPSSLGPMARSTRPRRVPADRRSDRARAGGVRNPGRNASLVSSSR